MGLTAFVLGGGGMLGSAEVGMLRALAEDGVEPGLILGDFRRRDQRRCVRGGPECEDGPAARADVGRSRRDGRLRRPRRLSAGDACAHPHEPLRQRRPARDAHRARPARCRSRTSPWTFQCVAASVERAAAHWFSHGPLVEAVLASCAVPGMLPAVRVGESHYLDGGLVDSLPVGRRGHARRHRGLRPARRPARATAHRARAGRGRSRRSPSRSRGGHVSPTT